jgi:hypothetical protein
MPPVDTQIGMTVSHSVGGSPVVEIPESSEPLDAIAFQGGMVEVRGRWRLDIPLNPLLTRQQPG